MNIRAFITASGCLLLSVACALPPPHLRIDSSVDPVTASIVETTWQEFRSFGRARAACFRSPNGRDR